MVGEHLKETVSNDTPLVSVITLSYNSPDLFAAIDSVVTQTYPKIEYIIVDDASNDFSKENTEKHIRSLAGPNLADLKIFVNAENKGIAKSGNIALNAITGKYVFYLAGDDSFVDNNVISDWVKAFDDNGSTVMTAYRDIYDHSLTAFIAREPTEKNADFIKTASPSELLEKMAAYNLIFGCCTAFTAECLQKYGPYNEKYPFIDDYPFLLKLLRNGVKIDFFDRVVVKYRRGGISAFENVKKRYIKESDLIFKNEVKPYVKDVKNAQKRYNAWKKRLKEDQRNAKYACLREESRDDPFRTLLLRLFHGLSHPKNIIMKITKKTEKK